MSSTRRAGIIVALALVLIAGLIAAYCVAALTTPLAAPVAHVTPPTVTPPAAASVPMPEGEQSAISVAGADAYLGASASGVFAQGGDGSAVPIASISKVVTALVVLEAKPLGASGTGPTITFTKADHDLYDAYYVQNATIAPMPTGSSMTEHDALETMLVVSACNYAAVLANWAYGSQPAFLAAAKRWLAAHGLTHTRMVEPTGLDARNVSSASDLVAIGKLAMADPALAEIAGKRLLDVPGQDGLSGTNDLLGTDGVDGIKTGTLDPYGSNLLFSSRLDVGLPQPIVVIGAILGAPTHEAADEQARAMLDALRGGFHRVALAEKGDRVGEVTTAGGATVRLVLGGDAKLLTWSNTPVAVTMSKPRLGGGSAGEEVGTATFTSPTGSVTIPVVLATDLPEASQWWRLTHPHQVLGW